MLWNFWMETIGQICPSKIYKYHVEYTQFSLNIFFYVENINQCLFRVRFSFRGLFCDIKCHVNDFRYLFRFFFFLCSPVSVKKHMSLSIGTCINNEHFRSRTVICQCGRRNEYTKKSSCDRVEANGKNHKKRKLWTMSLWYCF